MRRTWVCIQYVIALMVESEFWTTQLSTSIPVYIEARFGSDGLDHEAYLYVNDRRHPRGWPYLFN